MLGQPAVQNEIAVTIPSTLNIFNGDEKTTVKANQVTRQQVIGFVAKTFSNCYGGATLTDAMGTWYDNDNNLLVEEQVTIVSSYTDSNDLSLLESIAQLVKRVFAQDAVLIRHNGKVWFV